MRTADRQRGPGRPKKSWSQTLDENMPGTRNGDIFLRWGELYRSAVTGGKKAREAHEDATRVCASEQSLSRRRIQQIVRDVRKIWISSLRELAQKMDMSERLERSRENRNALRARAQQVLLLPEYGGTLRDRLSAGVMQEMFVIAHDARVAAEARVEELQREVKRLGSLLAANLAVPGYAGFSETKRARSDRELP